MTKFYTTTLMILTMAAMTYAQGKSTEAMTKQLKALKADKVFGLSYDASSDASKILGFSEDFGKAQTSRYNLASLRFGLAFYFPGKTLPNAPIEYLMTFQAAGKKPQFADAHTLKFTIDNDVLDLGDARYANKNEGIEYLNFKLTREQLAKLAKGKIISMKLGNGEFTLTAAQIKMFADLFALADSSML